VDILKVYNHYVFENGINFHPHPHKLVELQFRFDPQEVATPFAKFVLQIFEKKFF
jgi:hypothetical protein